MRRFLAGLLLVALVGAAVVPDMNVVLSHRTDNDCVGFADVPIGDPACEAIAALIANGVIVGYATNPPRFGPLDPVLRAQIATFIVRSLDWEGNPTGPRSFTDFGDLVGELRDASLILANMCNQAGNCVANGYSPEGCTMRGQAVPCFGANDNVSYAQAISFIVRAFQLDPAYAWQSQPGATLLYSGVPDVHQLDVRTYHHYAGAIPDAPATSEAWDMPTSRAWVARALFQALTFPALPQPNCHPAFPRGCIPPALGDDPYYTAIDPRYLAVDAAALITIQTPADLAEMRQQLIDYIWSGGGFPSAQLPDIVTPDITSQTFAELANLESIERLEMVMPYDLRSVAYLFHPATGNGRLMIYHEGHNNGFAVRHETIGFFLARGYAVLAFAMPLSGLNSRPVVTLPRQGPFQLTTHNHLWQLETDNFSPLRYFVEPVAVALNYAERYGYQSVAMMGLSGGGWTTTLYAALDPRIVRSYPIAGSLPLYLRSGRTQDDGDYEQQHPELYRIANYLELYVLGATGAGRAQLQVLNQFDACCFAGVGYRTYETAVQGRVAHLGEGHFAVFLDDTHAEHNISEAALTAIVADLEGAFTAPPTGNGR